MQPRDYQIAAADAFWASLCGSATASPVVVLPTGAGKSIVIAMIASRAINEFNGRVAILAHRKELIEQNAQKIRDVGLEVGIYSAGLNRREAEADVLVAGIQSVYNRGHELGSRQLLFVDEAHLVPASGEGMYRTLLTDLRQYNPRLRLGGCTATPFRLDCGPLCGPQRLFDKVCYSAPLRRLIEQGYLSPLTTPSPSDVVFDTSALKLRGGEFVANDLEVLFGGDDAKVLAACREIVARTANRRSTLVFCSGVRHAEKVAETLSRLTQDVAGLVVGTMDQLPRAATLAEFKSGRMRYCVCVDVLTTGFDFPGIDAVAVLRATMSPGLFAQMVGRGLRRAEGKEDCLILDFGTNFQRHGPLDAKNYGHVPGVSNPENPGEAAVKGCPNCAETLVAAAASCFACGYEFVRELKHERTADTQAKVLSEPDYWYVIDVSMSRHVKKKDPDAPNTLRVDYTCRPSAGGDITHTITEWVCLLHDGFAGKKARKWWHEHTRLPFAADIDRAIELFDAGLIGSPTKLVTEVDGHFPRVISRVVERPSLEGDAAEGDGPAPIIGCDDGDDGLAYVSGGNVDEVPF